ncbi:SagB family peptide dehydrogenase [Herbidospora sp. RD11066]
MHDTLPPFPLWSFREDVFVEPDTGEGVVVVHSRWEDTVLPMPAPPVMEALRRMSLGPISLGNVIRSGADRLALTAILDRLAHLVVRSFGVDREQPLVSVVPLTPQAAFHLPDGPLDHPVRLSRFAVLTTDGTNYLLESPLSQHRVILHRADAMAHLGALMRPAVPASVGPETRSVIAFLMAAGMVVEAATGDPFQRIEFAEDSDPALTTWTPIDLMFHTRSTLGRHDQDFGVTYPLGESGGVEPVVKEAAAGIPLPRPSWDDLAGDPPFSAVVEAHHPAEAFADRPMTVADLGALLYRTARVRALTGSASAKATRATSDRPCPTSDDLHELELYAVVDRCAGLPRGVYHYDPYNHGLTLLDGDPDELLVSANLASTPPVLLMITARFRRLSWKYNGLGYSLVLTDAGALVQTLSLAGTAMGLAGRRVDGPDIDASAHVFGLDWRTESSVCGFAVGHARERVADDGFPVNDADWPMLAAALLA